MNESTSTRPDEEEADGPDKEMRRGVLQMLAVDDEFLPSMTEKVGDQALSMILQCVALELVEVSMRFEQYELGSKFISGMVGGMVGLDRVSDDHPMPESLHIGLRERARFLGMDAEVRAQQALIDALEAE